MSVSGVGIDLFGFGSVPYDTLFAQCRMSDMKPVSKQYETSTDCQDDKAIDSSTKGTTTRLQSLVMGVFLTSAKSYHKLTVKIRRRSEDTRRLAFELTSMVLHVLIST